MMTRVLRWQTRPIAPSRAATAVGADARVAHGVQGSGVGSRVSIHEGLADLQGSVPRLKTTVLVERIRRAGAIPIGKTNVPEFGMGSHTYNHGLRHHAQSVRPYEERRRIQRRRGCGHRAGNAAVCRRRRSWRLASQSRQLQQHRRTAAKRRPGAECAGADSVRRRDRERPDGAVGRGCGVCAQRDGRRRCARPDVFAIAAAVVRRSAGARLRGHSHRMVSRSRRPAARSTRANRAVSAAADVRGSRVHRRRRMPGLRPR